MSLYLYIYLYYIDNFLNNILWFDYIKIDLFGLSSHHQFWWKNNEFKLEKIIPTLKQYNGTGMITSHNRRKNKWSDLMSYTVQESPYFSWLTAISC